MKPLRKMSITWVSLAVLAGALFSVACGGGAADSDAPGEPGEVKPRAVSAPGGSLRAVYEQNIKIMEDFSSALEKAGNADQVATALNAYTRQIEKLGPQMKALKQKHPELEEMERTGRFPDEVKDLESKFGELGMKMGMGMAKVMQYEDNPKVREAKDKMLAAAQKLMQ